MTATRDQVLTLISAERDRLSRMGTTNPAYGVLADILGDAARDITWVPDPDIDIDRISHARYLRYKDRIDAANRQAAKSKVRPAKAEAKS